MEWRFKARDECVDPRAWLDAAVRLAQRGAAAGDLGGLDRALASFERVLNAASADDGLRAETSVRFADVLVTRFELTGDVGGLEWAVRLLRTELDVIQLRHPLHVLALSTLGRALFRDAERTGDIATTNQVVTVYRRAVKRSGTRHPAYPRCLADLGGALAYRFAITGRVRDILDAIAVHKAAVQATTPEDPERAGRLSNLGNALISRSVYTGDGRMRDGVDLHRQAVDATLSNDPNAMMFLGNLGIALLREYEETGSRTSLDEAIAHHRLAVERTPKNHSERASRLSNLAAVLLSRYECTSELVVLDEAVQTNREAIDITPDGHPTRARHLSGLAGALIRRFEHTGERSSLREAVALSRDAVDATPEQHPNYATRMSAYSAALYRLAEIEPKVLGQAEQSLRKALRLTRPGHADWPLLQSNLGAILSTQYERDSEAALLDEAIAVNRSAVTATPVHHSDRGRRLSNLTAALINKARLTGNATVLDEPLSVCAEALDLLPELDPGRAVCLMALGSALACRFDLTADSSALVGSLAAFRAAADVATAPAAARASAALDGGHLAMEAGDDRAALEAFATGVRLMEEVAWRGIGRDDQELWLSRMTGLATDAAALAIKAGRLEYAVELLEQGRGVMLAQAINDRTQYAAIHELAPDLANELAEIQSALDRTPIPTTVAEDILQPHAGSLRSAADRRSDLARRRDALVEKIHARPGLEHFLRPPRFTDLQVASDQGPVIILNVSTYRCDALTVTTRGVHLTPLPQLTAETVTDRTMKFIDSSRQAFQPGDSGQTARKTMLSILEWMWDTIAEPVLHDLGITDQPASEQRAPRVWWCPTGFTASLPLHAAGYHDPGNAAFPNTTLDYVTSSYTPTLRALIHARKQATEATEPAPGPLIVAMPQTPGWRLLPKAAIEADDLARRVHSSVLLAGPSATHAAVISAMANHPWVHFTCHGMHDRKTPSNSSLILHDQPLTVRQIMDQRLTDAALAFLSACDTYQGGTNIPDEGITLGSALQLAGYHHVIATLWPIADKHAPNIPHRIYDQIIRRDGDTTHLNLQAAATALHTAILAERDHAPGHPNRWAAYIHTGS